jgi:anti-sigma factor RsiW
MSDPLSCADALDLVEPLAAGDLAADTHVRAHFESCPRCASALASARRIEAALAAREAPEAPARFTPAVLARVRRERWRTEQRIDWWFNVAVLSGVLLMIGGATAMFNVDGVVAAAAAVARTASAASARGVAAAAPSLPTYVGSIGLFISALVTWWWAERRLSL